MHKIYKVIYMNENIKIVPTDIAYTSCILMNNIEQLRKKYNFLKTGNIGYSVLGKPIPYVQLGTGNKEVMYSASFHANEWITSMLLMKFIEEYCIEYEKNGLLYGYNIRELFSNTTIYIIPMLNPDGVDLVTGVINRDTGIYNQFKDISLQFPNISFSSGWKANFNGVDFFNFQHTLLINRLDWRLLCLIILFSKFLHIRFFHYLLIYYHLLYLND